MQFKCLKRAVCPFFAAALALAAVESAAAPEVYLSISKGFGEKIIVAVPLFAADGSGVVGPSDVRDVMSYDLGNSGYFSVVGNTQFVDENEEADRAAGSIDFQEWLALGAEVLVKGEMEADVSGFTLEAEVYDLARGQSIFARRYVGEDGQWREATHRLADDIVRRLTGEAGIATTSIAFVSNATGAKEIYVMDYDGENRRRITRDNTIAMYPDWFPDGRRIVYTKYPGDRQELHSVEIVTGRTTRLTSFPGLNAFAAISPRGNEMLASLSRDGNTEIYRLRADGSDPRRLTYGRSTESSPCWSPDGRRVAFVSDRSGSPQIYVMSATGGTAERLTYQGGYNTSPDWSPKGDLIAFTSMVEGVYQICTVDVETREVVRLTTGGGSKEDPSWAPNGRHIVYSARSGRKSDLYMLDIFDLEPVRLTRGSGDYLSPAWSDRPQGE